MFNEYENLTVEECLDSYKRGMCCVCDGDKKIINFEEEK